MSRLNKPPSVQAKNQRPSGILPPLLLKYNISTRLCEGKTLLSRPLLIISLFTFCLYLWAKQRTCRPTKQRLLLLQLANLWQNDPRQTTPRSPLWPGQTRRSQLRRDVPRPEPLSWFGFDASQPAARISTTPATLLASPAHQWRQRG